MVVSAPKAGLVPAIVVPDEQTWTMLGCDPAKLGVEPTDAPALAARLLVADRLPAALTEPLAELVRELPAALSVERRQLPLPTGAANASVPEHPAETEADEGHEGQDNRQGGHGDESHDMMAIVGEPSADGLVMEPIALHHGPLGTSLPGGLLIAATLDGDVVAEANVEALLTAAAPAGRRPVAPDPLAPVAWTAAIAAEAEAAEGTPPSGVQQYLRIAAVELERALSHLAWLRAFGRVLGWAPLRDLTTTCIGRLLDHRNRLSPEPQGGAGIRPDTELKAAKEEIAELGRRLRANRVLRWRTAGRGTVSTKQARTRGLTGPAARASGVADDARSSDPRYRRLGFESIVHAEGDARARMLVHTDEAAQALELVDAALTVPAGRDRPGDRPGAGRGTTVEGPRGPVRALSRPQGWQLSAPGACQGRTVAGESMVGEEWASALVVLASFDLSPWEIAE